MDSESWFDGVEPGDVADGARRIREGSSTRPREWPRIATGRGFAIDEEDYYDQLHEATIAAARAQVEERERADDQQLVHAVRAMDDCISLRNELSERLEAWANSRESTDATGVELARELADGNSTDPLARRVESLAGRVVDLETESRELREFLEARMPDVAPNLSAMAGPVLAARLVSLAGGLESLAKQPSGTVQVLGAEDALFAHLRGGSDPPKHGIIYTHDYVRGTRRDERGSTARALAGKLAIAARIDHYSGEYRPELEAELSERIERIRARDST